MGSRPGFIVDQRHPADGGISPNAYAPWISVQVRCHFPPRATRGQVINALSEAYLEALEEVETHPWRNW